MTKSEPAAAAGYPAGRVGTLLRRYPTSLLLTLLVLAAGLYTRRLSATEHTALLERLGTDVDGFDPDRILAMPLATFVQSEPGVRWHMLLLVAVPLGVLERRAGSARAAITFLLSDWISAPLTLAAIWGLARLGSAAATRLLDVADAGSSAAAHGAMAAACVLLMRRWRVPALAAVYAYVLAAFGFQRLDTAIAHLLATIVGTLFGLSWRSRRTASG